jgi:hypothetical protein
MKIARILDEPGGSFLLEYDNTLGRKNAMRLDASTYEAALREARSFLGIGKDDYDNEGAQWDIE